jgi:hypothetical protein
MPTHGSRVELFRFVSCGRVSGRISADSEAARCAFYAPGLRLQQHSGWSGWLTRLRLMTVWRVVMISAGWHWGLWVPLAVPVFIWEQKREQKRAKKGTQLIVSGVFPVNEVYVPSLVELRTG